jgi:hypothetical protein
MAIFQQLSRLPQMPGAPVNRAVALRPGNLLIALDQRLLAGVILGCTPSPLHA